MNTYIKIMGCVAAVLVGCVATMLLQHPLLETRGAPWVYFYAFEMPLVWGIVVLVCTLILSQDKSENVGVAIGNWIRGGGFWAVLSKNNIPGNTWVVLALVLLYGAITYGPPTPTVDWGKIQYNTKESVQTAVSQPGTQSAISGVKGTINYLAKGFLGSEVIGQGDNQSQESAELAPRYQKGWWRIWAALFAVLFAPLVWVWGRRNELADKVSAFAGWFRQKPETNGSATSSSEGGGSSILNTLLKQTDASDQITNHVIGEFLTRAAETVFGSLASLMKKY